MHIILIVFQIELGFLMVGHTHEDIDQTFSCLSRYLRKHDAITMPGTFISITSMVTNSIKVFFHFTEMHDCCKAANSSVRGVTNLQYIFDIKSWLSPHLAEIHGHTTPHVFLFRKNADGVAVMFTKNWSHEEWEPQEGLLLLKVLELDWLYGVYTCDRR